MKISNISVLLLAVLFSLMFFSCKSTPKEAPPEGASKEALEALDTAEAKADAARKRAMDFESPAYFPSDWQSVESQYNQAKSMPRSNDAEAQQATEIFNRVAGVYDELFEKAVPLYAQALEDEILAVRKEIIDSGFSALFPEFLENADNTALKAMAQYEEKDYYPAKDTALEALKMYRTQETMAAALQARQEILDNDFTSVDPDNFDKAEEVAETALDAYEKGDIAAAGDSADEALLRYNLVLNAGWASIIDDLIVEVDSDREKALAIKANVAAKDIFADGEAQYKIGADDRKDEKYGDAARAYKKAQSQYVKAARATEEKRVIAEQAIKDADQRVAASDETARKAEVLLEGDAE